MITGVTSSTAAAVTRIHLSAAVAHRGDTTSIEPTGLQADRSERRQQRTAIQLDSTPNQLKADLESRRQQQKTAQVGGVDDLLQQDTDFRRQQRLMDQAGPTSTSASAPGRLRGKRLDILI